MHENYNSLVWDHSRIITLKFSPLLEGILKLTTSNSHATFKAPKVLELLYS